LPSIANIANLFFFFEEEEDDIFAPVDVKKTLSTRLRPQASMVQIRDS
jgi:hypothetical protein